MPSINDMALLVKEFEVDVHQSVEVFIVCDSVISFEPNLHICSSSRKARLFVNLATILTSTTGCETSSLSTFPNLFFLTFRLDLLGLAHRGRFCSATKKWAMARFLLGLSVCVCVKYR